MEQGDDDKVIINDENALVMKWRTSGHLASVYPYWTMFQLPGN